MSKIRICKTAQKLMDGLYDEGFIGQAISTSVYKNCKSTRFYFLAENIDGVGYEANGETLLKTIQKAIKDGSCGFPA